VFDPLIKLGSGKPLIVRVDQTVAADWVLQRAKRAQALSIYSWWAGY